MRRLFAIVFTALLVAGGVAIVLLDIFSGQPSEAERRAQRAADALTKLLVDRYELDLETLTAGRQLSEGRYDFRGALAGDLRGSAPIYGVVELTCAEATADPQCWTLVTFERDGEIWSPAAGAKQEQAEAEIAGEQDDEDAARVAEQESATPTAVSAAGEAPTGENAGGTQAEAEGGVLSDAEPAAETSPDAEDDNETAPTESESESASLTPEAPLPAQIFAVTSPVVNGRAGPGTEHAIVMKVTPELRLELIERREDWGRFRVVEGAAAEEQDPGENAEPEPWIWLQLVERRNADAAS